MATTTTDHPSGGPELRALVLSERARIEKTSRVRELVLGFQDGLLVPLAVVTGLAGASVSKSGIVVGGLAEAAAGALAMATGAFLASQAENQLFRSEIEREEQEIEERPDVEIEELAILLREEGVPDDAADVATQAIGKSRLSLIKTKVEKELGLPYAEHESARGDAVVVGASYAAAALIPLWPYFFWNLSIALIASLIATGVALFALGVVKGKVTRANLLRSGVQVLLVGGVSAAVGYLIGNIVPRFFE